MDILAEFERMSADTLTDYITARQEENLHLEFKTVAKNDMSRDDRKNLAVGLSGFANSDGGLIVWGVLAKKNAEGLDCATERQSVSSAQGLIAQLNEHTGAGVSPGVDGVRHKALSLSDGSGFAVTLVTASDSGPHMAKAGEDRYFKRSGDRFYRMEHFDLEDMFGRRRRPQLHLATAVVSAGSIGGGGRMTYRGKIVISILNSGRGPAHAPYLTVSVNSPYSVDAYGIDGSGNEGMPRLHQAANTPFSAFGANALVVLHPGTLHDVCALRVEIESSEDSVPDLVINYQLAAEEARLVRRVLSIPGAEIYRIVTNAG